MNNFITTAEIFEIALNRQVDSNLLKQSQIVATEQMYIYDIFNNEFIDKVLADTGNTYNYLIENYIKPVIAWGIIYNNFEYLTMNITDKGILQMLIEGTANLVGRESRLDAKNEIKNTLNIFINRLINYCDKQKKSGNEDYSLFDVNDDYEVSVNKLHYTPSTIVAF